MKIDDMKRLAGDKPPVIYQLLVKRWIDINGNSRGAFRYFTKDETGAIIRCTDTVRAAVGWFKRGRAYDWIITGLAEGAQGVAARVAADFGKRVGFEVRVEIMGE